MSSSPAPDASPAPAPTVGFRLLARLDAAANRLYGSRCNPLYQSGAITVALLALLVATGLYLLLFYRVGAPWTSVARLTDQPWLGRWIRGVHRLAADAALVAAAVHAFRMFAQRRSWGRRALPWLTGLALVGVVVVCGWTGYVMVWDTFGQLLAIEGARVLDLVPIFTEPLGRAFTGEHPLPSAFFFLNLFLHIALPIGIGVLLLVHVSRVARPTLFPARATMWTGLLALVAVAVIWPVGLAPEADALRRPAEVPIDLFYAGWLALARARPAWQVALAGALVAVPLLFVPRFTRPAGRRRPAPSVVNERLCTGCEQCALDCPWEAITMVPRGDVTATPSPVAPIAALGARSALVARVDPAVCVSCGICAGSCAPMGVGPAGRTGRDQLARARELVARESPGATEVVVVACARGGGGAAAGPRFHGAPVFDVECAGSLHSSVVEYFLRAGAGGVLVLACPPTDCWNREGARWLDARLFHEREAELQARVDRRRVAVAGLSFAEAAEARHALAALRESVRALRPGDVEDELDLLRLCRESAANAGEVA